MEGNQSLAKIGVFLLLGINVGATTFLAAQPGCCEDAGKAATSEKGATKLLPTSGTAEEQDCAADAVSAEIPGQPKITVPAPPVVMQTEPLVPSTPMVARAADVDAVRHG